ncbi:hypothetical protein H7H48_15875 [Nitratireductor sp. B36]|uniref:hypothetical protein n=1 Tax=Nitratireductor sp. B36 TaxID=2762059 RepID=UPI001E502CE2|nr:hypothetical protein [Nitratireductor sp. B36]MCC5780540.1 hypothetical protein [Nitratireductor sp. B36]
MAWYSIIPFAEVVVREVSAWSERRDTIRKAQLEVEVAELKAKAEIAAYKVKADVEWDLSWADAASRSWKDEFMLIIWAIPLIGLFLPGIRPFVLEGFEYLKTFHPDAPSWYMAGWAIIFAATFGFKQAVALMLPGKAAQLAGVLANIPDDIPSSVAEKAQSKIDKALSVGRAALK